MAKKAAQKLYTVVPGSLRQGVITAAAAAVAATVGIAVSRAVAAKFPASASMLEQNNSGGGDYLAGKGQVPMAGAEYSALAARHLSELIAIPTVDVPNPSEGDLAHFEKFVATLEVMFPLVHLQLERERINRFALLYSWKGQSADSHKTTVLMAHYDVVPVEDQDKNEWLHPGFSGHIDEEYVWGRGSLDNKGALVTILNAVETLLSQGFTPSGDVMLFFGNNEETAGTSASSAVELLRSRGIKPWLVLDEGGAVALQAFPGLELPAAVVGVAEKGILDVEIVCKSQGGHASTPPRFGATARLARAILALDNAKLPVSVPAPVDELLQRIGANSSFALRLVTANRALFAPVLAPLLSRVSDETRAMVRTTIAVTMLEGSQASNVIAATARATANVRIALGSSIAEAVEQMTQAINDPLVQINVISGHEPSPISPSNNQQFELLAQTISHAYPTAVVTPYVQTGATDARHFTAICPAVYRFSPLLMDKADRASLHAVNERVLISSLGAGVAFYRQLLESLSGN